MTLKYFGLIADGDTLKTNQTLKDDDDELIGNAFCGDMSLLSD